MFIKEIVLKNYRQYKDVTINLNVDNKKNISIILGKNGYGKTTLMNAISWCLYGKEFYSTKKLKGLPLLNNIQQKESDKSEENVEISLFMVDINQNEFKISRKQNFLKQNYEFIKGSSSFEILYRGKEDKEFTVWPEDDKESFIDRHFPESIHTYFLFDGEMLEEYFQDHSIIYNEVYKLSNLELLEKVEKHITNAKNNFRREVKNKADSTKLDQITKEIDRINNKIREIEDEKNKLIPQIKEAEINRDDLQKQLLHIPNVKSIEEQIIENKKAIKDNLNKINEYEFSKIELLIKKAPYISMKDCIKDVRDKIKEKIEIGEIPPLYKKDFLKKLLDDNKCICGTDLSQNNKHRQAIENLYKSTNSETNISEDLNSLYYALDNILSNNSFNKDLAKINSNIIESNQMYEKNLEIKTNLETQLKGFNSEEIKGKYHQLNSYEASIPQQYLNLGGLKNSLVQFENELQSKNKEYTTALEHNNKVQTYTKYLNYIEKVEAAIKKINQDTMEKMRMEIEKETKEKFFSLVTKESTFTELNIKDNYDFSVKDNAGNELLGSMGAGEREVLALSFIAALNDISGIDVPIIIDTPLARLDPSVKMNIADMLHNTFNNTQMILLVTRSELTDEIENKINDICSNKLKLDFREDVNGDYVEVIRFE
jgi:DNA sulfur modification protein DndD